VAAVGCSLAQIIPKDKNCPRKTGTVYLSNNYIAKRIILLPEWSQPGSRLHSLLGSLGVLDNIVQARVSTQKAIPKGQCM
jgi:hypothetical protein